MANRNYGFTTRRTINSKGDEIFKLEVAPYVGAGQPSMNSIANEQVKMAYFIQLAVCEDKALFLSKFNGSDRLLEMFINSPHIASLIEQERILQLTKPDVKDVTNFFHNMFGQEWGYNEIQETCRNRHINEAAYDKMLNSIKEHMLNNPDMRILLFKIVAPELLYTHPYRITSTSIDRVKHFNKAFACTGTTWNCDTWDENVRAKLHNDSGTEGSILIKVANDISQGKTSCRSVRKTHTEIADPAHRDFFAKTDLVHDILRAHLVKDTQRSVNDNSQVQLAQRDQYDMDRVKSCRMLLDAGGIFKTIPAQMVAERTFYELKEQGSDIEGIVYFHKFFDRDGGEFRLLKPTSSEFHKGEPYTFNVISLSNLQPGVIKNAGVAPSKCAAALDENHTTGTDMKLPDNASAVVTVDPTHTSVRDLTQAVMRLRQLLFTQSVSIAQISDDADEQTDKSISFNAVFNNCIKNQAEQLKSQMLKSAKDKISTEYKSMIMQYISDLMKEQTKSETTTSSSSSTATAISMSNVDRAYNIFRTFREFFVHDVSENLFTNYVSIRISKDGADILKDSTEKMKKIFEKCSEGLPDEDKEQLQEMHEQVLAKIDTIVQRTTSLLKGEKFPDINDEANVDATVEINQEQEVEVEIEVEQLNTSTSTSPRAETEIDPTFVGFNKNTFGGMKDFQVVSTQSREDLGSILIKSSDLNEAGISNFGNIMPSRLFISKNQRMVSDAGSPVIGAKTKIPSFFALSREPGKNGEEEVKIVAITIEEAKRLRGSNFGEQQKIAVFPMQKRKRGFLSNFSESTDSSKFSADEVQDAKNWILFRYGAYRELAAQEDSSEWISKNICPPPPKNSESPEKDAIKDAAKSKAAIQWMYYCLKQNMLSLDLLTVTDEFLANERYFINKAFSGQNISQKELANEITFIRNSMNSSFNGGHTSLLDSVVRHIGSALGVFRQNA